MIFFVVPGRPIPQERPIVIRRGWTIDPPRSRKAKKVIAQYATASRQTHRFSVLEGQVVLDVAFYGLRPNADLSNAVKLVEDALNGVLYKDDHQITILRAARYPVEKGKERTEITIGEVKPPKEALADRPETPSKRTGPHRPQVQCEDEVQ